MKHTEYCANCKREVTLDKTSLDTCPICNSKILPCATCKKNNCDGCEYEGGL